jgi:hypothetical protein
MPDFMKDHPFAVESFFDTSLVLTFAVEKEELISKIPECLSLDTFNEKWAFIAVALVKTCDLRPKGFPRFMGNDFILAGYRIFVRYRSAAGKNLRGLYILRSETDKRKMALFGNIFTHYNYQYTDIRFLRAEKNLSIYSNRSKLEIEISEIADARLPENSPFSSWKEARRYAGPLPFTFTYDKLSREILIIEGVRTNWNPLPVEVSRSRVGFIDDLHLRTVTLANAFVIKGVPYYWKKGKKELWSPTLENDIKA